MRQSFFILAMAIITLVSCNAKIDRNEEVESRLQRLNQIYDSAIVRQDTGTIRKYYADEYVFTNPEGQVLNKEQQLASISISEMKWDAGKSEDVKITVFGNAAVMTGAFRGSGTFRGNPISINERYSSFWILRDTSWLMAAEHVSVLE